jgi:hypothetical protein
LAPEQAQAAAPDPRHDVFALGRMVAWALGEEGLAAAPELAAIAARATAAGYETKTNDEIDGVERVFIYDPFGNRLEFLKPLSAPQ